MKLLTTIANWIVLAWVVVLACNVLALVERPGDPLDLIGIFWLLVATAVPVSIVSIALSVILLRRRAELSRRQLWIARFLLVSPLLAFVYFYVADYTIKFH
jgi:hypothetical protein